MSIAIIAYGSLIWDEECLAPHITGGWARRAGPRLPVEFSRVSPKRKGALVLAIDESAETAVSTSVTRSRRAHVEEAAADLARRERAPLEAIGIANGRHATNCPPSIGRIVNDWLASQDTFRAAIWTNLPLNFREETGEPFTHARGLAWLKRLSPESLAEAWRYITFAPEETDTPFRRFLDGDDWWGSLDFSGADHAHR